MAAKGIWNPVTKTFGELLARLRLGGNRRNFAALRHGFRTIARGAKDREAVDALMGHVDASMAGHYLEDGLQCELTLYDGKPISVELPTSVVREISYTEPAVRGDTSGKVLKPAKVASGLEVQVPLFVATGDKIEIDTRTGEYRRRV